ncbi:MAG: HDIG domain-containing protein [Leptolyngbyaceae cyanobacterium SM1_1_3]|nr:HDIG domain-containing protein [Leptolyngbyaceae cyanobacterium SM1_1_3]NJN02248.1 HDIG domain-containing protein [Leptolyngbyaceae cyanobacterium RM1_1_2]
MQRISIRRRCQRKQGVNPQITFALAVVSLTVVFGQRFYDQPELQVDTQSPQTFVAPRTVTVEDTQATEAKQQAARTGALPIFMLDQEANQTSTKKLEGFFIEGDELRRQLGTFPFVPTHVLSTTAQEYIRQAEASEWQPFWQLYQQADVPAAETAPADAQAQLSKAQRDRLSSAVQQQALRELLAYRQWSTASEVEILEVTIERERKNYQQVVAELQSQARLNPEFPFTEDFLQLSEADWRSLQRSVRLVGQRMLSQGIMQGLPDDLLRQSVQMQLQGSVPVALEPVATEILMASLSPNLIEDPERTRLQAEQTVQAVKPETVSISASEVIVSEGEKITQADFVLLDHFQFSRRRFNWLGLVGFGIFVSGGVSVFLLVEQFSSPGLRRRDYGLIVLFSLGTAGLIAAGFPAASLPAVGLLVGSFYGAALGGTVVSLLAIMLPIGAGLSSISLAASAAGALVGALVAARLRSREELALLGGVVGLTQGLIYLVLTLMLSPVSSAVWINILSASGLQALYGVAWSVVAIGLSPYLEHLFDLVTPIRLAELANPNRPLLKRLASNAPGTFQHTLFVSSLAEAAARALGCNVELVRAGTLYHDIGKMHDPEGFIENQMGGVNKHDEIDDPWQSADIIKKHVTKGIEMARKHRLPKAIQAFIPEHQGTMLISYFYHQAKEQAQTNPAIELREADFSYDGPIPQSPETGLVMLADSCEAALRSLKEATPEEALSMVNKILRARWRDGQLSDSCLSRENMDVIADIFVRVWQQYNHKRIAYPKAALP